MSFWQDAIEALFDQRDIRKLKIASAALSARYRREGEPQSLRLESPDEYLAYLAVRMPATYSAVDKVLKMTPLGQMAIDSVLDAGSGPGTALWALHDHIDYKRAMALEIEPQWIKIAKDLWSHNKKEGKPQVQWQAVDLQKAQIPTSDLVIASYSLNELTPAARALILQRLYQAANKVFIWIEPGTPECFEQLAHFRSIILQEPDVQILGPCTGHGICPLRNFDQMPSIGPQWCHFSARLERSRLHREIKGVSMGYEDEKFCYLALAKKSALNEEPGLEGRGLTKSFRLMQEPKVRSGHVRLCLCDSQSFEEQVATRSQKQIYRAAKDAHWGDLWPVQPLPALEDRPSGDNPTD